MAKKRQSVFVPNQVQMKEQPIDLSADKSKDYNSDEDNSDFSPSPKKAKNKERFNLLNYNAQRRDKLNDFDFLMDNDDEGENLDEQAEIMEANKLHERSCNKDLVISLYWEEKIVLIIKVLQLYGILFFFYYEKWPGNIRMYATSAITSFNLSFYILS